MIRRAILKAIAIPGYQVPFASREMPMPYGWGTGGIQVTAAIIGPDDVLKVIDQGADDTTNAVSIRRFFAKTAGVATTTRTAEATIIQTRHRIPEDAAAGRPDRWSTRCRSPSRCASSSRARPRRARMHALDEYGLMHVKLYEDIARHGHIATTYAYPVMVERPLRDGPVADPEVRQSEDATMSPALQLFGAGREKRIYAVPPYTQVVSLDFEDHPFEVADASTSPARCAAPTDVYLDEVDHRRQGRPHVRLLRHRLLREPPGGRASRRDGVAPHRRARHDRRPPLLRGRRRLSKFYGARDRLRRRLLRSLAGRGAGRGRRIRLGQDDAAATASRRGSRRRRAASRYRMRDGELRDLYALERGRAPLPDAHRLGLRAPGPARRPAHDGVGRRQCRRAADGGRRPPLRRHPRDGASTGSTASRSTPTASTTSRAPSPAACASACRSPATWSPSRGWCSWTSRPAASTSRCRRACSTCCAAWSSDLGLAAIIVTHDLAVARLLSHRMMVMKDGRVVETGLTDQVLDDPREPYTQLLVSSILQV